MDEETTDDPPLSTEQQVKVKALSTADLIAIDEALFDNTAIVWRKVARIVMSTMQGPDENIKGLPDIFYAQRIKALVENGKLESQGNLNRMRYSEVKRPDTKNETTS